jgi:DnaK suppressor protein
MAEMASVTVDREIDYGLEESLEHELEAIETALARIEDGTFGACQRCGQPIGAERLEALPYVMLCIDCKRLEERG